MTDSIKRAISVFTPEAVTSINRAYVRALALIGPQRLSDDVRVAIAEHMMRLAREGERDETRLCTLSVARTLERERPAAVATSDG